LIEDHKCEVIEKENGNYLKGEDFTELCKCYVQICNPA